jgi:acyl-coenzyme A synthetase/AMP-(fatty) acid ligase/acyl carrier protein
MSMKTGQNDIVPTIPSAVAEQVSRRADHVALRDGARTLTYQRLGHAVAAGVRHLVELGVTDAAINTHSGTHVNADITTEQAPVIVIAPLGMDGTVLQLSVLFSGRVCAPLETTLSVESLATTIRFIDGPVICLEPTITASLTAAGVTCVDTSTLTLDALLTAPATELVTPIGDAILDPDRAALLCFTSGSTGTPKGILVPHSQLTDAAIFAGTLDDDVVGISSPPSFFASMLQTLVAIGVGGTGMYLDLNASTPRQLHDIAINFGLSQFTGTTTHVRELAKESLDTPIASLWGIDLGGEQTTRADLELFRKAFPKARIRNIYGSAEAGRIATSDYPPDGELPLPGPIPAGHAGERRTLELFDDTNQRVASGQSGRIAIHRPEPFLGYWRNPELTATRTLTTADGRIWVLSGDIGRFSTDGSLTVLGRTDDQVKIRGRFLNPREVDALLLADPRIQAATTIAIPAGAPTHLCTIAVATNLDDEATTQPALRNMLAQTLPLYALPRNIIFVDHIPSTTRGKPDTAALQQLAELGEASKSSEVTNPVNTGRTMVEESLLGVIRELLAIDLSITDDIFAMGADSLLAVELIETIAEDFGTRISPAQLVANPTAAKLAELLRNGITDDSHPGLTTLFSSDHSTTAFWVLGADESFGPARLAQHMAPVGSFCTKVIGAAPPERLLPSITAIGEANAKAIDRVRSANTVIIGFSAGTLLALETACAMHRQGTPARLLILIDPPDEQRLEDFRQSHQLPSPLRHPYVFWRMRRKRDDEMRRPFVPTDSFERSRRFVNRHTRLFLDHTMTPYPGTTAMIISREYVESGGTAVTDAGLAEPCARFEIPGDHQTLLVNAEPLAELISRILREHGLLPSD